MKIVLQTSKESDLKATNQEQTEEKYVTNDSNRSGQPAQGGSFDVIQSIFTPVHELRFENLVYRGNNRLNQFGKLHINPKTQQKSDSREREPVIGS